MHVAETEREVANILRSAPATSSPSGLRCGLAMHSHAAHNPPEVGRLHSEATVSDSVRPACARLQSRTLATVTDAAGPSTSPPKPALPKTSSRPAIQAAVILNRSPFLTRTPSPFESAYHAYQARIQRALFNPFPDEFYFRPGSILEGEFNQEEKQREKLAFGGPYVKDKPLKAAVESEDPSGKPLGPMPRVHEADVKNDVKSLDRLGERNLYLLVHGKNAVGKDVWRFPQGGIEEGQALHQVRTIDRDSRYQAAQHLP